MSTKNNTNFSEEWINSYTLLDDSNKYYIEGETESCQGI